MLEHDLLSEYQSRFFAFNGYVLCIQRLRPYLTPLIVGLTILTAINYIPEKGFRYGQP